MDTATTTLPPTSNALRRVSVASTSLLNAPCFFLGTTLAFTAAASACMTLSLMTDRWEVMTIDFRTAEALADRQNMTVERWDLGVVRVATLRQNGEVFYLVPLHGGVDSLCVDISEEAHVRLEEDGHPLPRCVSYLTLNDTYVKNAWECRMRNLAISCGLVTLILLGSCALVGIFGLLKKQISAIMVTGVMFVLAALFSIFTLCFMYFKRLKPGGLETGTVMDRGVPPDFFGARVFLSGWSVSLGWGGVALCIATGVFWLLLAKVLRFRVSALA